MCIRDRYEGDLAVLQSVVSNVTELPVTLDQDVASKLSKKVLETYIKVLNDAGASYVPADTDKYFSAELNVLDKEMKTVFSIDTEIAEDVYKRQALTFLVISCPCALVISIPLGFFAGIGGASNTGVLVKGSNYLETLAQTKYVVFDLSLIHI